MHKACEWYGCVRLDKDAKIAELRAENERLREALALLLHEVDASGNGYAADFGWPKATRAAREALRGEGEGEGES
jgi:hypothetical protein